VAGPAPWCMDFRAPDRNRSVHANTFRWSPISRSTVAGWRLPFRSCCGPKDSRISHRRQRQRIRRQDDRWTDLPVLLQPRHVENVEMSSFADKNSAFRTRKRTIRASPWAGYVYRLTLAQVTGNGSHFPLYQFLTKVITVDHCHLDPILFT